MPSIISHAAVPIAIRLALTASQLPKKVLILAILLAALPDLDSIGFWLGVPYESQWGHRGFTHSVVFAAFTAALIAILGPRLGVSRKCLWMIAFISMASHGMLDMFTDGGHGVALFWPFTDHRFIAPWRVIEVSPISVKRFLGYKGLEVLASEFLWIWLPCLCGGLLFKVIRSGSK